MIVRCVIATTTSWKVSNFRNVAEMVFVHWVELPITQQPDPKIYFLVQQKRISFSWTHNITAALKYMYTVCCTGWYLYTLFDLLKEVLIPITSTYSSLPTRACISWLVMHTKRFYMTKFYVKKIDSNKKKRGKFHLNRQKIAFQCSVHSLLSLSLFFAVFWEILITITFCHFSHT